MKAEAAETPPATPAQAAPEPQPAPPTGPTAWMDAVGIAASDRGAVDYIVSHESGWCPFKHEGQIGYCPSSPSFQAYVGYGLCQSTPGDKMSAAGGDWQTNPVTQLAWCNSYAVSRYGGWQQAYSHWLTSHNW